MRLLNNDHLYFQCYFCFSPAPAPLFPELLQANALLKKNLENAKASLEVLVADLQFLRDQQTITQVKLL
jgi:hypothetical protein